VAKIVIDGVFIVRVLDAMEEICFTLPAGTMESRLAYSGERRSLVTFRMWGRPGTSDMEVMNIQIDREPQTLSASVAGGRYCLGLKNESKLPSSASNAARGNAEQDVELRVTITPSQP
jgi:hypothetical protein